jgi:hypothetical protein
MRPRRNLSTSVTEGETHLLQRELPRELLERRFEIPGGQILVWLGTDLVYGGVDVLDQEGTLRHSWEDEVDSEEDLSELMTAAGIAMKHAREIARELLEERGKWEEAQRGKRWWRWGRN